MRALPPETANFGIAVSRRPAAASFAEKVEFSYPGIVAWEAPREGEPDGFTLIYTWHRSRMAVLSMSLTQLHALCEAHPPAQRILPVAMRRPATRSSNTVARRRPATRSLKTSTDELDWDGGYGTRP